MEAGENQSQALKILILQHPAEARRPHGTAQILLESYPACRLRRGFHWKNLAKAWGQAPQEPVPRQWGVLFLSSRVEAADAASQEHPGFFETSPGGLRPLAPETRLEGLVLLDGNWKEAKTIWWRNPWLLRLRRLVLVEEPLTDLRWRRGAHRSALTTMESAYYGLRYFGEKANAERVEGAFRTQWGMENLNVGLLVHAPSLAPAPSLHQTPPLL